MCADFSADGGRFLAVVAPPDAASGSASAWDVVSAKPTPQPGPVAFGADGKPVVPPELKQLAQDPGREGYTSGTRSSTTVQLAPTPLGVDLVAAPGALFLASSVLSRPRPSNSNSASVSANS